MNVPVTELIAVNYKLCSHCGSTKEDIAASHSDVITKVDGVAAAACDPPLTSGAAAADN